MAFEPDGSTVGASGPASGHADVRSTPSSGSRAIVVLACLGQLLVVLDISVVNVALPSIRADLGLSTGQLSWVVNAYTIAFAGFVLLGGRVADLVGHRNAFVAGATLFSVASLVGGFAAGPAVLIGARGAQGLGAALLAPATLTLLTTETRPGAERSRAIGIWAAMGAAGGAVGAVVGGVLVDLLSWHWVFLFNVPLGLVAAVGAMRWIPLGVRHAARRPDVLGAATVTIGLAAVVYAITSGTDHGWTSTAVLLPLGVGLALLGLFVLVEARVAADPLVPLGFFRIRTLVTANGVGLAAGAAGIAMWYFITLYEQEVLGLGPIAAGLGFVPHTVSLIVGARLSGRLLATVEPRRLMAGGLALTCVGFLVQAQASAGGSYVPHVMVPGVLICFGTGLSFPAITQVATAGVPAADAGLASGVLNTARWFGGALGLATLSAIAAGRTSTLGGAEPSVEAVVSGYDAAFYGSAAITFIGLLLVALVPRTPTARPAAPVLPELETEAVP